MRASKRSGAQCLTGDAKGVGYTLGDINFIFYLFSRSGNKRCVAIRVPSLEN